MEEILFFLSVEPKTLRTVEEILGIEINIKC